MIVSAPNAAGKTTLLKTTTINIIVTQQVGCGFYASSVVQPYTHIHSYLNIPDTSGRDSLFQAESRRCKEIITLVKENPADVSRHFCIFDELYSGTNPTEAGKSAYAFLKYLSTYRHVDFMLTTHYVYVCKKFKKSKKIANYKMGVIDLANGEFQFTYTLEPGISEIQGAIKILKEMDYPAEMIQHIEGCK
jgi:DNA mismatch repair ATPase MutS